MPIVKVVRKSRTFWPDDGKYYHYEVVETRISRVLIVKQIYIIVDSLHD